MVSADRPERYTAWREGDSSYDLALPNGRWRVVLAMFEPDAAKAATRAIRVAANGAAKLTAFSPARAAGGAMKRVTRPFEIEIRDGHLRLVFSRPYGAVLSAIEVTRPQ